MHFRDEDPIGRRIELKLESTANLQPTNIPPTINATIVGIVPNVRQRNFQEVQADPVAYVPFRADPRAFMWLLTRIEGSDPSLMTGQLREEVRDRPLTHSVERDHLVGTQRVEVRHVTHEPLLDQAIDERVAEFLDVHCSPRREVENRFATLRGALGRDAPACHFARFPDGLAPAGRACRRKDERREIAQPMLDQQGEEEIPVVGDVEGAEVGDRIGHRRAG